MRKDVQNGLSPHFQTRPLTYDVMLPDLRSSLHDFIALAQRGHVMRTSTSRETTTTGLTDALPCSPVLGVVGCCC